MNSVRLIGNVGGEVLIKDFDGRKMASFSLATNENYIDKSNEEVKQTSWHRIVAWGQLAQICESLLDKGKLVSVEGKIVYRQYQNKEDQTVNVTEIQAFKVEEYSKAPAAAGSHG
ncbi:single-stranded DNA-binding protein [Dyadobacter luticola]|uniref:Single-stranded DNA-binding protein n=1 Tax=Dyadobacter luticola TaxID=1979387 RepID=A0A5R9KVP4_9BACT|nr:single-stranded DNA-binding protein [Dyadobacter luticola]TLV00225.1 single-stranded DNA-binding protein [Dyadobacter luticola]